MEDNRVKKLLNRVKQDNVYVDDLIDRNPKDLMYNTSQARDLAQKTLGNEYLKQTGVSIPNIKRASNSQVESFLNKVKEEAYPELFDTSVTSSKQPLKTANGLYYPDKNVIKLAGTSERPIDELVGTLFHESGHAYDNMDKSLNSLSKPIEENISKLSKDSIKNLDELDAYDLSELLQKGHHKTHKGLREGSYGFGALKNFIKKGTFKGLAPGMIGAGISSLISGRADAAVSPDDINVPQDINEQNIENVNLDANSRQNSMMNLDKQAVMDENLPEDFRRSNYLRLKNYLKGK